MQVLILAAYSGRNRLPVTSKKAIVCPKWDLPHEIPRPPRIGRPSGPQLQQAAGLYRQNIQGHLQFRNGRANFRVVSDLLLQRL